MKNFNITRASMERMESKEDGELYIRALKKLVKMKPEDLRKFLGKPKKILFGCLKQTVSDVSLEFTEFINTRDFFKTKSEGGIFADVDKDIFSWFDCEVKNSPAKVLASYELTEKTTEENILSQAKDGGIYEEMDLAHVKQVCERHITKGEKIFKEDGSSSSFPVRNKSGDLCEMDVWMNGDGWYVDVFRFNTSDVCNVGDRIFFGN